MICEICGCTENTPCPLGCAWLTTNPPVCTECDIDALAAGLITQDDIDRYDFNALVDPDDPELDDGPLIIPASEYEAQQFIEERRKAKGAS